MIILGIDPGTALTGYAVVESLNGKTKLISCGCIKTPAGTPLGSRLVEIHDDLNELIATHKPTLIGIEQLFFCNNAKTALSVGHARGVVLLCAVRAGMQVLEFTPLQVKQALTGYGKATKQQMQEMVRMTLGLSDIPKPDDAADAVAIALCAEQSFKRLS